jgi:hypothetical protein
MEVSDQLHIPAALPPEKETSTTFWIRSWVGPRPGLDAVQMSLLPLPSVESESSTTQPVARHYTY